MLLAHSREFVLRMSDYVFQPYIDAEECDSYIYPGELDLACLDRFRAGHPECPGDVTSRGEEVAQMPLGEKECDSCRVGMPDLHPDNPGPRRRRPIEKPSTKPDHQNPKSAVDKVCLMFSFVSLGVFSALMAALACWFLWTLFSLVASGFAEIWFLWCTAVRCYPLSGLAQWRACVVGRLEGRAGVGVSDGVALTTL